MAKTDLSKQDMTPIVQITLVNYDSANQDEYRKRFISPLLDGLLKRMQLSKAEYNH